MRKYVAVIAVAFAIVACSESGTTPTGPTVPNTAVSPSGGQTSNGDTPTAVAPESGIDASLIKIKNNGTVVNNTGTTLTACLFDAPYGEGTLVEQWKAKPGQTSPEFFVEACAPITGQIDITDRGECPQKPLGWEWLAANPNVVIPFKGDYTHEWTLTSERKDKKNYDIVVVSDKGNPSGTIVEGPFSLGGGESTSFRGYPGMTLHVFFRLPNYEKLYSYYYDGESSGFENDCEAEGGQFFKYLDHRKNVCITPVNHGIKWSNYDHREDAWLYKYNYEWIQDGWDWHYADSASSGSCSDQGEVIESWRGDAKLLVQQCLCTIE